ncbi:hypothetical protein CC77DRAFT_1047498 [Alternaria alternata]|uniref:BTB domain-containing protein n=2 Tax=Alternaria alternata complex TaxID=187734 RepID=A0A177DY11_ALTAL|nr:hypothetical protein CC77DRAFT_1047498 [Alternaria alternata]XP_051591084.1 uncharacterized protein J4E82_002694 [Alternaria postmessia]RII05926.1 hypothetical protein CUC08_Gglean009141 [Alternaria sp. MG1]RYN69816.1 hypothetical protein AA0118_g265 [Alternaria tenuissima]KAI5378381.1 hypothetical protein J4E82_002694 [Alternaria postmessia]OAG23669.1 hypothetical protein CC77DRAFT_1047498 [Alternaria alternata]RYO25761.1 hypothetical protein AA0121_g769 [Alternaria tenuissima]
MVKAKITQVNKSGTMSFESTSAVTIRVGEAPNTKDFIAHEAFLTSRSEFFRRAMNGNWKEAETCIINLPDDTAEAFACYINHVYTGQLPTTSKTTSELKKLTVEEFEHHVNDQYRIIFDVFVLSEKLQDVTTKNAMMEAALATAGLVAIDGLWRVPTCHVVNAVYNGTPAGSPARRLVTDLWTAVPIESIFSCIRRFHQGFVEDLGKSLQNNRKPAENIPVRKGVAAYQEEIKEG